MKKFYFRVLVLAFIISVVALMLPGISNISAEDFPDTGYIIDTVAGTGTGGGYSGDGNPAVDAKLNFPYGVAVSSDGTIYFSDCGNHRIRKVDPAGVITTVAGTGTELGDGAFSGDGGQADSAQLNQPSGVAIDDAGNIYIADTENHRIRKVDPAGVITTVAGTGNEGFSGDGGQADSAELNSPRGVAVDGAGYIYIADTRNNRIRKVDPDGVITTVAGTGNEGFSGDGEPAVSAELNSPAGVVVDVDGNIYIADTNNHCIRKVDPDGVITTVAGEYPGTDEGNFSGDGGPATEAMLYSPGGVAVTGDGSIFFTDTYNHRLRKVDPDGVITTVAGTGTEIGSENGGFSGDGGPAVEALLWSPMGVAVSSDGMIYFADTFNHRIRKLECFPLAIETTVLPRGVIGNPYQAQLVAAGGAAPYTWSVTGLPAGLECSSAGVISGTPEQTGSFEFMNEYTVQVTVEDAAGALASKTLTLKVCLGTGNGAYIVTPEEDPAYSGGLTAEGIVAMTVNSGVSGFRYFNVSVTPVTGHAGNEVLVFVHLRGGKQIGISTVKADFDAADLIAGASFNVRPGDVIKVYLVDNLTNDPDVNPVVL